MINVGIHLEGDGDMKCIGVFTCVYNYDVKMCICVCNDYLPMCNCGRDLGEILQFGYDLGRNDIYICMYVFLCIGGGPTVKRCVSTAAP